MNKKITHVCGFAEAVEPLNKLINPRYKLPKLKRDIVVLQNKDYQSEDLI